MPRVLPALARWTAAGGVIVVAVLAGTARPQDAPRQSTLCILVQVKNQDVSAKEIEETLAKGIKELKFKQSQIRASRLRPETLDELQRLMSSLEPPRGGGTGPLIRQKGGDRLVEWEFNLNVDEPGVVLTQLELKAHKGDKEEKKVIDLTTTTKPDDPVVRTALPGTYVVRLPAGFTPVSYVAHYQTARARQGKSVEGQWPAVQQCFLVTVKDFEGDYKELLDFVRRVPGREPKVANPFDDYEKGQDIAMVFATVGFKLTPPGSIFDENRWVPVVQGIENTDSHRVWMLFPLKRDEVDKKLEEYRKLSPKELSDKIREEKPRWAKDEVQIAIDDKNLVPAWVELPRVGEKRFSREFRIKDVRALQKALPEAYRLIVYEFGTPEDSSAQAVQDGGARVFVIGEAIKEWPEGIKGAADKATGKPK
jgi:hypothetical protein